MRLWSNLPNVSEFASRWRRPRILNLESLAEFMAAQSAFVAQKCIIDYCQARSGLMWPKLEKEQSFRDALDHARWEAYPLVLSDVGVMVEGLLRPALKATALLPCAAWLALSYAECLNRYGPPKHRGDGANWNEDIDTFRRRLAQVQLAPPRPIHEVGGVSGRALYRLMPIHPDFTRQDASMIGNNVKLRLCRVYEDLERQADLTALAARFDPTT